MLGQFLKILTKNMIQNWQILKSMEIDNKKFALRSVSLPLQLVLLGREYIV